jgi:chromosome segregation ATPase
MANYVHGASRPLMTEADLAQARARNAELAAELRKLDAIGERLAAAVVEKRAEIEAETEKARKELTTAYRQLRSKVRQLDAVRANAAMIENTKTYVSDNLPPALYGGREGLEAATDEMAEYEARRNGRTIQPRGKRVAREQKPALHGTSTAYRRDKCRCPECKAWLSRTSSKHYRNRVTRQTLTLVEQAAA